MEALRCRDRLFVWLLLLSAVTFHVCLCGEDTCPAACSCSERLHIVDCKGKNLRDIPSNIPSSTTVLYLGHNLITTIPANAFQTLVNLKDLSLNNNEIVDITDGAFTGLSKVKSLYLTKNNLQALGEGVFRGLTGLHYLYLSQNQLNEVPNLDNLPSLWKLIVDTNKLSTAKIKTVKMPQNLTTIVLANNPIPTVTRDDLQPLLHSPIHKLDFSRCDIQVIEKGAFTPFPSLQSLVLSQNKHLNMTSIKSLIDDLSSSKILSSLGLSGCITEEMPADLFQGLANVPLHHLDLSHSENIRVLKNGTFNWLRYLEILDLSWSKVVMAEDAAFSGLDNLSSLHLYRTPLKQVPLFSLPRLLTLDISFSPQLEEIGSNQQLRKPPFYLCQNLQNLTFAHSAILKVYKNAFVGLTGLIHLDLSFNRLAGNSIGTDFLSDMKGLKSLNLGYNKLAEIKNEYNIFQSLGALEELNMQNNSCSSLPKDIFKPLVGLKKLKLDGNRMCSVLQEYPGVFRGLEHLEVLHLEHNHIHHINDQLVEGLVYLRELHLTSNRISFWEGQYFNSTSKLKMINFTSNEISLINRSSLEGMPRHLELDLSANPFACSCDLMWFRNGIKNDFNDTDIDINLSGLDTYRCNSPEKMAGEPLLSFNPDAIYHSCFPPPWKWILIATGCTAAVITATGAGTMYRKRWQIKLKLYNLKKRIRTTPRADGYEAIPGVDQPGRYDMTISYTPCNDRDREWVRWQLLRHIDKEYENEHDNDQDGKYNVFIEDKIQGNQFELGVLAEAFENSKKQILVVSHDYVRDALKHCEMEQAYQSVQEQGFGLDAIVIILMDEGAAVKLPKFLRPKISHHEELVWTAHDENGQKLFWQQLDEELARTLNPLHLQV